MGINATFSMSDVRAQIAKFEMRRDAKILSVFQYVGEQCVNHARSLDTYEDKTKALRNSIGYSIFKNGKLYFDVFPGEAEDAKAADEGRRIAASQVNVSGWCLVVVAGMNYAAAVESKGYDVLSSAEHLAESILPSMLSKLK